MAIQTINLGTYANDGTGDDLRTAFQKVNANILELASTVYGANVGTVPPISGVEEGELWWSTTDGRMYVYYSGAWVESSPATPNTAYQLSAETTTGGSNIRLSGADSTSDDIKIASGTNITVTRTDASTITLSSTSYTGNVIGDLTGNADTVTNGVYTTSSINALLDVDTTTAPPFNGQALVWNSASSKWVPGTVTSGGGSGNILDFGTFTDPTSTPYDFGTF